MKFLRVMVVGLVACGTAAVEIPPGDPQTGESRAVAEPQTLPEEAPQKPGTEPDGASPSTPEDSGLTWTEPPTPPPDASTPDTSTPPDAMADAEPDAADAAPPMCVGYVRLHVDVGTCVKAVGCAGLILIGGDPSLGAGAAAFPYDADPPAACVSNDQDSCVRYNHPSASNPKAFDVFIKPSNFGTCVVTNYTYVGGTCPVNAC
jgi:hypothetical protein